MGILVPPACDITSLFVLFFALPILNVILIKSYLAPSIDWFFSHTQIAEVVDRSLDQHFPASEGVRVIAEPGRYFVTKAFTLAVCVIAKKIVNQADSEEGKDHCLIVRVSYLILWKIFAVSRCISEICEYWKRVLK